MALSTEEISARLLAAVDAAEGHALLFKAIGKAVKGARAAAIKPVLQTLFDAGTLALVAEGKDLVVRRSEGVLSPAELDALPTMMEALKALIKLTKPKAKGPRPTITKERLAAALRPVPGPASVPVHVVPVEEVLLGAFAEAPAPTGLIRVPTVIGTLETQYARAALLQALDTLARRGALELRPESGLDRVSDEDRARCLPAIDGTPLSYARLIPVDERPVDGSGA